MWFKQEVTVKAPVEIVWWAWTISDRVSHWLSQDARIEAKAGGAYELFFLPDNPDSMSTKGCRFTEFEPMQKFTITWKGPDDFASLMNDEDKLTLVTVALTELENGVTKVTLDHYGWGEGPEWEEAFRWHQIAWQNALESLISCIENGEGDLCCKPA